MKSAKVKVHKLVIQHKSGQAEHANGHITHFERKDGSTVSNECFQIMTINESGLITKAVESARNFDDSRAAEGTRD